MNANIRLQGLEAQQVLAQHHSETFGGFSSLTGPPAKENLRRFPNHTVSGAGSWRPTDYPRGGSLLGTKWKGPSGHSVGDLRQVAGGPLITHVGGHFWGQSGRDMAWGTQAVSFQLCLSPPRGPVGDVPSQCPESCQWYHDGVDHIAHGLFTCHVLTRPHQSTPSPSGVLAGSGWVGHSFPDQTLQKANLSSVGKLRSAPRAPFRVTKGDGHDRKCCTGNDVARRRGAPSHREPSPSTPASAPQGSWDRAPGQLPW